LNATPTSPAATAPPAAAEHKNFVTALAKGLEVLTCFNRTRPRLTVSEVARATGSTPASARRSLLTLQALDYLGSDGKVYWMQPKALRVANAYLSSSATPQAAQPFLDALSERTRESASLAQLVGDEVIIIARSTARRSLSVGLTIGSRLPAYCSALGRMLLAGLPSTEAVRARLRRMERHPLTPRTIYDTEGVLTQVARARERGYAVNDGELELGVRSMAVPVFNRDGQAIAAMSIAVQADRNSISEMTDIFLPPLLRAQGKLAERLYGV